MLVMPAGAATVYPGVRQHRVVEAFVAENLSHSFKPAGLIIEQDFRAQVTSLVRSQCYAGSPSGMIGDQHSKSLRDLWSAVNIDE